MAVLKWDQVGERFYETGTKQGVLYVQDATGAYPKGVAWNGLSAVTESPDGAEANDIYADDIKYLSIRSVENYKGTIEAYTYPDEFGECDGSATLLAGVTIGQQPRKPFGFSWVTTLGNDTKYDDYGYKIHIVWGATASPSEKSYQTINDSPEAITFSWEIDTIPVPVTGHKPTAHMEIDSTKVTKAQLRAIKAVLYGTDDAEATPAEYAATKDTTMQAGKTYYTRSGSDSNYTYTQFDGESFSSGTTYYEMTEPAHEATTASTARLPLPDEVLTILMNAA